LREKFIKNNIPLNHAHKQPNTRTTRRVVLMSQSNDDEERKTLLKKQRREEDITMRGNVNLQ
jgi:hypothetical protein